MLGLFTLPSVPPPRWSVDRAGIEWKVQRTAPPHLDHIETSGETCSLILRYGTGEGGALVQTPRVVWPMLRTLPNNTHASLQASFEPDQRPTLILDGSPVAEVLEKVRLDGVVNFEAKGGPLEIKRTWFVDRLRPVAIERLLVRNRSGQPVRVALRPAEAKRETDPAKGVQGAYAIEALPWQGEEAVLKPRQSREMAVYYTARTAAASPNLPDSPKAEEASRRAFVRQMDGLLDLQTPDPNVNRMFRFAKIRAAESLFRTQGGLIHSPGGGSYYAAIWANDQAEYANPLFGYLGYEPARETAANSFDWFARYMNPEYRPIPSSIIAEGLDSWNGAGDRGDMAMIAYGAARYVLAYGDRTEAARLWPLVEWCLEYLRRKESPEGVLPSDSDELEGRFPAGKMNLNTSCLAYDGLLSSAALATELGHDDRAREYRERATRLRTAIGRFFGASVEGFETYRYYDGNDVLRAWIATPLTVGIYDRAAGTIDALLSPRLWTDDGLASQAGDRTFWDRATLYGFRGVFAAGAADRIFPRFRDYTNRRLTGEHVPYAVEAYPEGNQRHLSAESALYVRAITEGLMGLRPVGLHKIELNPQLPTAWREKGVSLDHVAIGGTTVRIRAKGGFCEVTSGEGKPQRFPLGKPFTVELRG